MAEYTYYCEVNCDRRDFRAGVYKVVAEGSINRARFPELNRVIQFSDCVWKQGPRGGVKIIKNRDWPYPIGYITKNNEWMQKFVWVKLKAKTL